MDKSIKIGALSFVATMCILALPSLAGANPAAGGGASAGTMASPHSAGLLASPSPRAYRAASRWTVGE